MEEDEREDSSDDEGVPPLNNIHSDNEDDDSEGEIYKSEEESEGDEEYWWTFKRSPGEKGLHMPHGDGRATQRSPFDAWSSESLKRSIEQSKNGSNKPKRSTANSTEVRASPLASMVGLTWQQANFGH